MGTSGGPYIVRDSSLVLELDVADKNSYSGSGTVWNDLSGNNRNGTLTNGPIFDSANGGSIVFDGTNDYVLTTYTVPAQNTTTSFSWSCWVYPLRTTVNDLILGNRGPNTVINFIKLTAANFEYYAMNFGSAMSINSWQNICIVKNLTNFFYYKNGIQIATTTSSATLLANPFFVGGDNTAAQAEFSQSKIALAQIYNRALSATEVLQNYNELKSRFGL